MPSRACLNATTALCSVPSMRALLRIQGARNMLKTIQATRSADVRSAPT